MKSLLYVVVKSAMLLGGFSWVAGLDAAAQLSPNCERNGKHDYCAVTPVAGATTETQSFDLITFADHTVYEVTRSLASCKKISENVERCNAKIIAPPGSSKILPAFYRRTFHEGGVKQEYVAQGIHLTYFYLD